MAERPGDRQWTRRDFVSAVARAGAGLAGGAALAEVPWASGAQGMLKPITASHSVSTFVYGQHLVAPQRVGGNRRIMGDHVNGPWLTVLGWTATGVMTAAAAVFIAGSF
jgi:Mn2+/Fe2+ NRAMP family transporter